jgi:hypothetical protein
VFGLVRKPHGLADGGQCGFGPARLRRPHCSEPALRQVRRQLWGSRVLCHISSSQPPGKAALYTPYSSTLLRSLSFDAVLGDAWVATSATLRVAAHLVLMPRLISSLALLPNASWPERDYIRTPVQFQQLGKRLAAACRQKIPCCFILHRLAGSCGGPRRVSELTRLKVRGSV